MTGGELALVLATVLCVLGFVGLILVLARLLYAVRDLHAAVAELRADTEVVLDELRASVDEARDTIDEARDTVEEARDDLERFDRVLGSAEAISARVRGGPRATRLALSAPVIKTVALASGTSEAARRLTRREKRQGRRVR